MDDGDRRDLRGCGKIAAFARGHIAVQYGAEPGQVAGLGQFPNRALAGLLKGQAHVFQPEQRGVEGLREPAGPIAGHRPEVAGVGRRAAGQERRGQPVGLPLIGYQPRVAGCDPGVGRRGARPAARFGGGTAAWVGSTVKLAPKPGFPWACL